MTIHEKHSEFLAKRGIRCEIAEAAGVVTSRQSMGNCLAFPYRLRGEIVNRKYRLTTEKKHMMDSGGTLCLWNGEVLRSKDVIDGAAVIITEGEFDALAAMQAGFKAVVSVPNGAPAERIDDPANSNRYAFLWEHEAELKQVKKFIIATDGDAPGQALSHDLISLLGPERCAFVTYPDGCKDLNDVLQAYGERSLVSVIDGARLVPVQGLCRVSDFPDLPEVRGMDTGVEPLRELMQIVLGSFTVFTGYSNMGKSTILNNIIGHALMRHVPVCLAGFETLVRPVLRDGLAKAMLQCSNNEMARHENLEEVYDLIDRKLTLITNAFDEDLEFDIETFLETARVAVERDGAKIIIIDPWNELEHKRGANETETDYTSRAIRMIKKFARRYNVAFWVIAHPTKPQKGVNAPPSLYDISGSAHWANKPDYGLVYHRKDKSKNEGQLIVSKVRMGYPGRCDSVDVFFNHKNSQIEEIKL